MINCFKSSNFAFNCNLRLYNSELSELVKHFCAPSCDFDLALSRARPHAIADLLKTWLRELALPVGVSKGCPPRHRTAF